MTPEPAPWIQRRVQQVVKDIPKNARMRGKGPRFVPERLRSVAVQAALALTLCFFSTAQPILMELAKARAGGRATIACLRAARAVGGSSPLRRCHHHRHRCRAALLRDG